MFIWAGVVSLTRSRKGCCSPRSLGLPRDEGTPTGSSGSSLRHRWCVCPQAKERSVRVWAQKPPPSPMQDHRDAGVRLTESLLHKLLQSWGEAAHSSPPGETLQALVSHTPLLNPRLDSMQRTRNAVVEESGACVPRDPSLPSIPGWASQLGQHKDIEERDGAGGWGLG